MGLPDEFVEHGDPAKLMAACGLDAAGIEASILRRFADSAAAISPLRAANDTEVPVPFTAAGGCSGAGMAAATAKIGDFEAPGVQVQRFVVQRATPASC